jgi:hypothetical protein
MAQNKKILVGSLVGLGIGVVAVGGFVAYKLLAGIRQGSTVSLTVALSEDDTSVCQKAGGRMKFVGTVQGVDADQNASVLWNTMESLDFDTTINAACAAAASHVWKRSEYSSGSDAHVSWLADYLGSSGIAPTRASFKNLPAKPKVSQLVKA